MITVAGLTKAFGSRTLLREADFFLGPGDRVALVGPNGSGKTTFLEMLAGLQAPDDGRIDIVRGTLIGYLAQETDALRGRNVLEEVVASSPAMREAGAELERVKEQLEHEHTHELLSRFSHLQDRFEVLGGYGAEAEARRVLHGLGFRQAEMERATDELSGGWLMRVALAKLLTAVPDVLLLDEPTNHLDLDSVIWLESFLKGYAGAVLLVSHDRDFMNSMANRVVEIADRKLVSYTGNFEAFVRERAARAERTASAARNQAKRVAQVERFIERFRYKNTKAKQVQSRVKMLDRMERVQAPSRKRRAMKVGFPPPPRSGEVVAELEDVGFSYGEVGVYDGLDVTVLRGEKVALVGPNGAGKTTLLKLLAGALHPQDGHRRLGHNVSCGYFAQHAIEALEPRNRLVEELQRSIPRTADIKPRDLLGRFLFSGDDVDKPVSVLSGGERTRLAMAKLLCEPHNFLCLDEPTNHLDMESRDVLEDALEDYSGALVLITHDRHLIRSIANRIVEVTDGVVTSHPGDYESYLWRKTQQGQPPVEAVDAPRRPSGGAARERRREDADRRARLKTHRDAMKRVEAELETLTAKVTELESKLADPVHYADASFVTEASHEHGAVRARIAELEAEWDAAAQALAEAESSPEPEGAEPRRGAR